MRGYCSAVRSALTDDGHPPLQADGLPPKQRLEAVSASLQRVAQRGARCLAPLTRLQGLLQRVLQRTAVLWLDVIYAWRWVHKAAHILGNKDAASAPVVQQRFDGLLVAMRRYGHHAGTLAPALERFAHVACRWHTGLFHCYDPATVVHGVVRLLAATATRGA